MKINRGKLAVDDHDSLLDEQSKKDLDKIVEELKLVKDGKINMKIKVLTLPTPIFGEEGDGIGGGAVRELGGKGGKRIESVQGQLGGDHHGEYKIVQVDFDEFIKYYQKLLLHDLELPIQKKIINGSNPKEEIELNNFSREGMRCDLDLDMTFEQAYDRAFRENKTTPEVDPRIDGWYWEEKPTKEKNQKSLEIYVMDVSGSVNGSTLGLIRKLIFCIYYYLDKRYDKNERRYIVFQDNAEEKTRDEFFSIETSGGTHISSGLEKALEIAKGYNEYDKYLFFFSDFDNSGSDDSKSENALNEIVKTFTYVGMSEVSTSTTRGTENSFAKITKEYARGFENLSYVLLNDENKIKEVITRLLNKNEKSTS